MSYRVEQVFRAKREELYHQYIEEGMSEGDAILAAEREARDYAQDQEEQWADFKRDQMRDDKMTGNDQ